MNFFANTVTMDCFVKTEEKSTEKVYERFLGLIPFDIKEEKVPLKKKTVLGFNKEPIQTYKIKLKKKRHTQAFMEKLRNGLSEVERQYLVNNMDARMDQEGSLFVRLKLEALLEVRKIAFG